MFVCLFTVRDVYLKCMIDEDCYMEIEEDSEDESEEVSEYRVHVEKIGWTAAVLIVFFLFIITLGICECLSNEIKNIRY